MKQIILVLMLAAFSADARGREIKFQSGEEKIPLLELYTSEGCSSCPPAEAWLSGMKDDPGLWRDFVPVAFHVDYWDYLGWRDPWAKAEFSNRQRAYAGRWQSQSVYTPGFVLDGKEWTKWPQGKEDLTASTVKAGVLAVASSDTNRWSVDFSPVNQNGAQAYEIHAALLGAGLNSEVKAGENRGRRLVHDFAVLKLVTVPLASGAGLRHGEFVLASPPDSPGTGYALAVWITRTGSPEPVQASGGWIIPPPASRPGRK